MTADCVGGVWTYALDLADALAPHGIEVQLATMGRLPDSEQRRQASRSAIVALHEADFRLEWDEDPWREVDRAGDWLLALAEEWAPDIVHLNGYSHAAIEWSAPVVVAAHSDVLSWWRAVKRTPPPERLRRYRDRVEAGLRQADAICAPTQAVVEDLAGSYDFDTTCFVVPNGRSFRRASAVEKEQLIVGLGRFWDEAKNMAALERVARRVPWSVLLAGPGTKLGRIAPPDCESLLARAAIFASPARYEPFGLTALEAAQSGCALVLGDIPSLREVWGDAAVYVPPDDDEALLESLRELCTDEAARRDLARRAAERAERYTATAMAESMAAVYAHAPIGAAA